MTALTKGNINSWFATLWTALHGYRETCIPEGRDAIYDDEWSDITTAMAWLREEVEGRGHSEADEVVHKVGGLVDRALATLLNDSYKTRVHNTLAELHDAKAVLEGYSNYDEERASGGGGGSGS